MLTDSQSEQLGGNHGRQAAPTRWFWVALLVVTGFALVMRLYRLDHFPLGFFWDEAYEGLDAYSLFGKPIWHWPIFFTAINGREPLFVYLVHLAQSIWGPSVWSVRVVSAMAGALLTPAVVWLGWEMAASLRVKRRNQFALWAGVAVLALLWSQTIARLAQRMSLFALLETIFFAALWRAWRTNLRRWWIMAGILAGLSFYTYLAARAVPTLLVALLGLALLSRRAALWDRLANIGVGLATTLIVAAPLLIHFIFNPGDFNMRTSQVSFLSFSKIPALFNNVGLVVGMAFIQGDPNGRLNYPNRPVLDLLTLAPFLVGMGIVLWRFWRPANFFLLATLGIMLLPTLLSDEAPNFGRSIGALPVFALLIALGLDRLAAWVSQRSSGLEALCSATGWGVLLISVTVTWYVYFVQYANLPELFNLWDTGYTQVARDIAAVPRVEAGGPERIYADADVAKNPTVEYLAAALPLGQHPHGMDGQVCVRVATAGPARYYLTREDRRGEALVKSYLPDSRARAGVADATGRPWVNVIEQPTDGRVVFPEMIPRPVSFGDGIELLGYWISQQTARSGDRLYVRLYWQVTTPQQQSYTTFAHMDRPARDGGPPVAGSDTLPGNGACPTTDWQPGEVIVDELQFVVPADAPNGDYVVVAGLYDLETMQRLQVAGSTAGQINLSPIRKVN